MDTTKFTTTVALTTRDGGVVAHVEILPFNELPTIVMWGLRVFQLASPGSPSTMPVYRECFFYAVPPTQGTGLLMHPLYRTAKAVVQHWQEFGPKTGMDECVHHLAQQLQQLERQEGQG